MEIRVANRSDLDGATETITLAFATDPVWRVALARPDGRTDHHAPYWRMFLGSALRQGSLWLLDDGAAVSVWVPPGGAELSAEETTELERRLPGWLGEKGATDILELYERFEASHPHAEPHAYLSLLATHPDHRGQGIGQMLLAANLADWDSAGVPAYLESTNPANDHRYERLGFQPAGGFTAVRDGAPITTMWRDVGGAGSA